ncbi:hypothetical protein IV500_03000 [Paeniglutamicibacter antarcticus]|uniref:Uncharacterized protein n=1 Tax=Arthrobacter terrae TaxID=2935737 RepID=A0A931CRN7_9MICC|nr:hypothetical protein [Arthrobacter terrae]
MIHVRASTLHPASVTARIGDLAEQVFRELTGSSPAGWGVHEPVSEPWDVAAVTGYCYAGAPAPAALVVVGNARPGTNVPTIATLTVERTATGVHESLELLAETTDPLSSAELESFAAGGDRALTLAGPRARLLETAPSQSVAVTYAQEPLPGQLHPLEEYMQLVAHLEGADG